jgi:ubiquinone/menaquinone biosynthesis C-methylase UbiE
MNYDQIAKSYNELHREEQLKKIKLIIDLLKIKEETVLDVGCGTAFYSNLIKNYTGIDPSKEMIKQAKIKIILGQGENLPFKNKEFDTVISISAIHNFKDPIKGIEEIKRVAKNKIAISVFKRAKKLKIIENQLKDFNRIEEDKDIIFYKFSKGLSKSILFG